MHRFRLILRFCVDLDHSHWSSMYGSKVGKCGSNWKFALTPQPQAARLKYLCAELLFAFPTVRCCQISDLPEWKFWLRNFQKNRFCGSITSRFEEIFMWQAPPYVPHIFLTSNLRFTWMKILTPEFSEKSILWLYYKSLRGNIYVASSSLWAPHYPGVGIVNYLNEKFHCEFPRENSLLRQNCG